MLSFGIFDFWGGDLSSKHNQKLELLYFIHLSTDCPETWYIELHLLCLDATQAWEPDVQSWCFYFVGGDPGMTKK
jgi:hypothetical protein